MPNYGHMTAYRDFLAVMKQTAERRQELAEGYLQRQLDTLDDMLEGAQEDLETLGSLEELLTEDPTSEIESDVTLDDVTKFISAKAKLIQSTLRLMERQGTLVPIEIPKKLEVERTFNIDTYLKLKQEVHETLPEGRHQLEDGTTEGEFTEISED